MRRSVATLAVCAALLTACAAETTTPSVTPSPSPSPSQAPPAQLILTADGTITRQDCELSPSFGGCPAIFAVMPGDWSPPPDWLPSDEDAVLTTIERPEGYVVTGQGTGGRATLLPGDYTLALGIAEFNDTVPASERFAAARLLCQADLTVGPQTVTVAVTAHYGSDCRIDVTLTPEG